MKSAVLLDILSVASICSLNVQKAQRRPWEKVEDFRRFHQAISRMQKSLPKFCLNVQLTAEEELENQIVGNDDWMYVSKCALLKKEFVSMILIIILLSYMMLMKLIRYCFAVCVCVKNFRNPGKEHCRKNARFGWKTKQ